ncbi:unnamed protein product [Chondrus crispus]|uniref:Uncharacterized protein n=1 Tax=Chondrus crispus TaxID=2769 RepID=R7QLT1_CHOCR|nr:unnamed protein product [Chondrus crispus]CDF39457.1 unnamed protein product [Chondrus crispus]|eukprot:XP_005719368.1 unnamed protein product [Chondrus crispus]
MAVYRDAARVRVSVHASVYRGATPRRIARGCNYYQPTELYLISQPRFSVVLNTPRWASCQPPLFWLCLFLLFAQPRLRCPLGSFLSHHVSFSSPALNSKTPIIHNKLFMFSLCFPVRFNGLRSLCVSSVS